jgi:serine/threonine-protein kinase
MAELPEPERIIGRYALFGEIASGGMATVHLGRLIGPAGFARIVAIKRLHPQFAKDPEFVSMFLDEARLAARIRHPNVVSTLDVVALDGELFIVMDYVEGESLARLRRLAGERGRPLPVDVSRAIFVNVLHGLHAAHETRGETGAPLGLIHRDVSPQNVLVGVDGIARLVDFGVAKAAGRMQQTKEGVVKGKIAYMSPEQLRRGHLDRRTDVYASSVVLWEVLAGRRLFTGDNDFQVAEQILGVGAEHPPSHFNPLVDAALDAAVMRGMRADPTERHATALEMADVVEQSGALASARSVGQQVFELAAEVLTDRARRVSSVEGATPMSTTSFAAFGPAVPARRQEADASGPMSPSEPTQAFLGPAEATRAVASPVDALAPPPASAKTARTQSVVDAADAPTIISTPRLGASTHRDPNAHRAALIGVGIAFAVAFGVGLTLLIVRASSQNSESPSAPVPTPSPAQPAATRTPAVVPSNLGAVPVATALPEASLQPPASALPPPPAAPRPTSRPRPADPCNPPHYFDGPIKKLKPGCY